MGDRRSDAPRNLLTSTVERGVTISISSHSKLCHLAAQFSFSSIYWIDGAALPFLFNLLVQGMIGLYHCLT